MHRRTGLIASIWFLVTIVFVSGLVFSVGPKDGKVASKEPAQVMIKLYVYGTGLLELDLEEYLVGVVAAELPASFGIEAHKAQAVAARTYIVKRLEKIRKNGSPYPEGADITNLPQEGQAWISEAERLERWQSSYSHNQKKIQEAVLATKNQVLTYNGQLIEALYCSTAGPHTEDAQEVFRIQLPYLKAQPNPFDSHSPRYKDTKTFSIAELGKSLGVKLKEKELLMALRSPQGPQVIPVASLLDPWLNPDKGANSLKIIARNRSGRVSQVAVGGRIFSGTEIRSKLGLRSTNFTYQISSDGKKITFYTTGYGHGVGMSQYGADGMANKGYNYKEILAFYYPGTDLVSLGLRRE